MVAGQCVVRRVPDQLELFGQPVQQLQYAERRRHVPSVVRLHADLDAVPLGQYGGLLEHDPISPDGGGVPIRSELGHDPDHRYAGLRTSGEDPLGKDHWRH